MSPGFEFFRALKAKGSSKEWRSNNTWHTEDDSSLPTKTHWCAPDMFPKQSHQTSSITVAPLSVNVVLGLSVQRNPRAPCYTLAVTSSASLCCLIKRSVLPHSSWDWCFSDGVTVPLILGRCTVINCDMAMRVCDIYNWHRFMTLLLNTALVVLPAGRNPPKTSPKSPYLRLSIISPDAARSNDV